MSYKNMKTVRALSDIPNVPHFVIITIGTVHVPGDERSRTNPGHGYPAHDVTYPNMEVTTDEDEWKAEIATRFLHNPKNPNFQAYKVSSFAKMDVNINISTT